MKTVLTFFAILTLSLQAQEPAVQEQVRSRIDEYENRVRANTQKIMAATTEEERARYRGSIPSAGPCAAEVMKLIRQHPGDTGNLAGIIWLITQAAAFPESQEALDLMTREYLASPGIAPAVKTLEYQPLEKVEPILNGIREQNPHPEEKAAATYALGMQHFRRFEAALNPAEAEASKAKAMDLFQEIVTTYPQVTIQGFPIADQAGKMLFEMSNLSVGAEVPEIEGADMDGRTFKLSDYRRQHVLLVFWGDWCHACHGVLPLVNQLAADMEAAGKNLAVLGVNTDLVSELPGLREKYQLKFRNWADGTTSGPITSMFNLRNFPTLYLIGPDGRILLKQTSADAVREKMNSL